MPKEIFYFLAMLCLVSGVRLTKILICRIKQQRNSERAQQVIAEYCEAVVRAKQSGFRPEKEDVEKVTMNTQSPSTATSEISSPPIKSVDSRL